MDFVDLRSEEEIQLYNCYSQVMLLEEEETWYPDRSSNEEPKLEFEIYEDTNAYIAKRFKKSQGCSHSFQRLSVL